jgi:TPR repeat protein
MENLIKLAKQGDANAQNDLGMAYWAGAGVDKDPALAINWLLRAAEQGLTKAQYKIGMVYKSEEGGGRDLIQAGAWFSVAAKNGHKEAIEALSEINSLTKVLVRLIREKLIN